MHGTDRSFNRRNGKQLVGAWTQKDPFLEPRKDAAANPKTHALVGTLWLDAQARSAALTATSKNCTAKASKKARGRRPWPKDRFWHCKGSIYHRCEDKRQSVAQ